MSDLFAVDLTAWNPILYRNGEYLDSDLSPVFCLPAFAGEPALVGKAAAIHRRASDPQSHPGESLLNLKNRGRYLLGEGWLAMTMEADSLEPANVQMMWRPPGVDHEITLGFVSVIKEILLRTVPTTATVGLVIPDALGPGPRQEILDILNPCFNQVFLIPRTVAVAAYWCEQSETKRLLRSKKANQTGHLGTLLVTTSCPDAWEAACVPIRAESKSRADLFCPINERVDFRSEIGVAGIPHSGSSSNSGSPTWVWHEWLVRQPGNDPNWAKGSRRDLESAFRQCCLPTLIQKDWALVDALEEVREEIRQANYGPGILGWLHLGDQASFDSDPTLQGIRLRAGIRTPESDVQYAAAGASVVLKRLQDGHVPYFESLAKVDLYIEGRNSFRDPVQTWRPLIEEAEVPAGRTYRSPKPIDDILLKAGEAPEVSLYLRSKRLGKEIIRHKRVVKSNASDRPTPLKIYAAMDPGQGLAKFEVESQDPGVFYASVRESEAEETAGPPELTFGWPIGSAWVISHPGVFHVARQQIRSLCRMAPSVVRTEDLTRTRNTHNSWSNREFLERSQGPINLDFFDYPRDLIHKEFIWFAAFPSSIAKPKGEVGEVVEKYGDFLCRVHHQTKNKWLSEGSLFSASWLQMACPSYFLEKTRVALSNRPTPGCLAIAGQCFVDPEDCGLFFMSLVESIENNTPPEDKFWLRAYRNLIRFRHGALKKSVLPAKAQARILEWYLDRFEESVSFRSPEYLMQCSYLAPHILKRRRYDPSFLEIDSREFYRFQTLLDQASHWVRNERQANHIRVAIKLLNHSATLPDLASINVA